MSRHNIGDLNRSGTRVFANLAAVEIEAYTVKTAQAVVVAFGKFQPYAPAAVRQEDIRDTTRKIRIHDVIGQIGVEGGVGTFRFAQDYALERSQVVDGQTDNQAALRLPATSLQRLENPRPQRKRQRQEQPEDAPSEK